MSSDNNNILTLYRMQDLNCANNPCVSKNTPVKRVIINSIGKVEFNPDCHQFIYFSRTKNHHVYYVFKKMLKIISDEFNANKHLSRTFKDKEVKPSDFYTGMSMSLIKQIRRFFNGYIKPTQVELVMMHYLEAFNRFFESAARPNKSKPSGEKSPEISDTSMFGGAYGLNGPWLELFRTVNPTSSITRLSVDRFFDVLIDTEQMYTHMRRTLKSFVFNNPDYANFLETLTYCNLQNPDFYDKNASNNIVKWVNEIEKGQLYNQDAGLNKRDFARVKRELRFEISSARLTSRPISSAPKANIVTSASKEDCRQP